MECKFIDDKKMEVEAPSKLKYHGRFTQSEFPNELQDFFRILPWFKEKVNDIYICPLNENAKMMTINSSTVQDNECIVYYHVNKTYYKIQAGAQRRSQRGSTHKLENNKHVYEFIVGIVTDHGLFQQNDEIFEAQKQFIANWKSNVRDVETKKLLESPVDLLIFSAFFRSFLTCTIGMTSLDYVESVIDVYYKLFKRRGNDFIDHACNLMIFLNPKLSLIHIPSFTIRFKKLWYKPDILPYLSENDKLFEIFADVNTPDETKNDIVEKLFKQKMELKQEWISSLLVDKSSVKMRGRGRIEPIKKQKFVDLPSWKKVCKNVTHLQSEKDEDLVYFKDGSDIYGFTILQMFNIVEQENSLNPYTGQPFEKESIKRFLDTYVRPREEQVIIDKPDVDFVDDENELVQLIETHLCLFERVCMKCRKKKSLDSIFIETYNASIPILNFCSSECMSQYSLDEFKLIVF